MDVKETIHGSFGRAKMVMSILLDDLTDDEILQRPVPGANHIAWQLGHLISSLNAFGEAIQAGSMPALPDNFRAQHAKETAGSDDPAAFLKKDQYVQLLNEQRQALLDQIDKMTDEQLSADSPEQMRDYAPKMIDLVGLSSDHEMMHSGQITVLRRKLGKAVAF